MVIHNRVNDNGDVVLGDNFLLRYINSSCTQVYFANNVNSKWDT